MTNKAAEIKELIVPLLGRDTRYDSYDLHVTLSPDGSYMVEVGGMSFLTIYHDDDGTPYIQCMTVPPQRVINILNNHKMNKVEQAIEIFDMIQDVTNLPLASDDEKLKASVVSTDMSRTIIISMNDGLGLSVASISKTIFFHGSFTGKEKVEAHGDVARLYNAINVS